MEIFRSKKIKGEALFKLFKFSPLYLNKKYLIHDRSVISFEDFIIYRCQREQRDKRLRLFCSDKKKEAIADARKMQDAIFEIDNCGSTATISQELTQAMILIRGRIKRHEQLYKKFWNNFISYNTLINIIKQVECIENNGFKFSRHLNEAVNLEMWLMKNKIRDLETIDNYFFELYNRNITAVADRINAELINKHLK